MRPRIKRNLVSSSGKAINRGTITTSSSREITSPEDLIGRQTRILGRIVTISAIDCHHYWAAYGSNIKLV